MFRYVGKFFTLVQFGVLITRVKVTDTEICIRTFCING